MKGSQAQLVLPLLEALDAAGGRAATRDIYETVASKAGIGADAQGRRGKYKPDSGEINFFHRSVRWAQQRAKLMGLAEPTGAGEWRITKKGKNSLTKATPGVVLTIFVTDKGAALWSSAEDAMGVIHDGSCQLLFTSPPYPISRGKSYGTFEEKTFVDWLIGIARDWPKKLTTDGSIVINLADAWLSGRPTLSLYVERLILAMQDELGLGLCQRFHWHNPSKMPAPAEWVTVRRIRVKPSVEHLLWFAPIDSNPYADNRAVLEPYSASMRARLAAGGETRGRHRPSGYALAEGAFGRDNGGAIPPSLIVAANTEARGGYIDGCKKAGLPVHPARFPAKLAEFFIKFLTREQDLVVDPFGGSGTTAAAAEGLNRRWIISELMREYLLGGKLRFPAAA